MLDWTYLSLHSAVEFGMMVWNSIWGVGVLGWLSQVNPLVHHIIYSISLYIVLYIGGYNIYRWLTSGCVPFDPSGLLPLRLMMWTSCGRPVVPREAQPDRAVKLFSRACTYWQQLTRATRQRTWRGEECDEWNPLNGFSRIQDPQCEAKESSFKKSTAQR
jgi:hypothetical protein